MTKPDLIYWDSCVFIDAIQETSGRYPAISQFVAAAQRNEVQIVASMFAKIEVCKLKGLGLQDKETEQKIIEFFDNDYVTIRPVDDEVTEKARELLRTVDHLKPPDATHVATAIINNIPTLHSYDPDMLKMNGKCGALVIETPYWRGQNSLPAVEHTPLKLVPSGITISRKEVGQQ